MTRYDVPEPDLQAADIDVLSGAVGLQMAAEAAGVTGR